MKRPIVRLIATILLLNIGTALVSSSQAQEIPPVSDLTACSLGTTGFVLSLQEKQIQVTGSSATVTRSDNPTARNRVLVFVIGPSLKNTFEGLEKDQWAAAQDAVVSVNLSQVQAIMARCPDVAEVHIGLQQSDFIREFVVTQQGSSPADPVVIERVCAADGSAQLSWNQQHCL
jgi:hypothetical protein